MNAHSSRYYEQDFAPRKSVSLWIVIPAVLIAATGTHLAAFFGGTLLERHRAQQEETRPAATNCTELARICAAQEPPKPRRR